MMMIYEFSLSLSLSLSPLFPTWGRRRATTKDLGFERDQTGQIERELANFFFFFFFGYEEGWLCGVM